MRARSTGVLEREGPGDGTITEMVACHELQHQETMRQTLFLAGLPGGRPTEGAARSTAPEGWIEVPGGAFCMGAADDRFAFDNERPRHAVELRPFRIARRPVTNASWLRLRIPTNRNWDLPQRRQIFSSVRLAQDL